MNSYERVMCCLNHQPADRLPLDGRFHPEVLRRLGDHFGTDDREAIEEALGIDFDGIGMRASDEFRARASRTPRGLYIVHPDGSYEDEWGVRVKYDAQHRYYRFVYQPLADDAAISSYRFPDLDAPGRFRHTPVPDDQKERPLVAGISNLFKLIWHIRGLDRFMMDLVGDVDLAEELLDRALEYNLKLVRRLAALGVDILGDVGDVSMQNRMMMSPTTWRTLFKPREAQVVAEARRLGIAHCYFHTDGNPMDILDDLVEIGFDMIDPVQPESVDPAEIKRRYGKRLTLHGCVSAQQTLPFGTVEDVRAEVLERIRTCGYDGGLIIAGSNVVQPDVPLENILAMYDTVKEVGARAYTAAPA